MKSARPLMLAAIAMAFGLFACSKSSEPGCTIANCETLWGCALSLYPVTYCGSLPPNGESEAIIHDQVMQECIDACNAGKEGPLLQCVGDNFGGSTCQNIALDAGPSQRYLSVSATCAGDGGSCGANCLRCWSQCDQANTTCNDACLDAGTLGACLSCNAGCGAIWAQCNGACPTN